MSLTDETNAHTIDIPLPEDQSSDGQQDVTAAAVGDGQHNHQSVAIDSHYVSQAVDNANNAMAANPYANIAMAGQMAAAAHHQQQQQQQYQAYYQQYYSSAAAAAAYQPMAAHMMSQQMAQQYPYFMPQMMRPMVPIVPHIPQMTPQMAAIVNHNSNAVANSGNNHNNNHNSRAANQAAAEAYDDEDSSDSDPTVARHGGTTKASNSPYFKNTLFQLKTYHEVIDEIFYSVRHLEPWEKGSRKVGGQTGMCGSVRGVGAGGIISTPFCILYKLFTLKLTRKQVNGLIRHKDSPYIRSLGFMYIRYTQPPQHLFNWFEPFLEDEEEVDPKAGGGQPITIGQMCRHMLTKLDWYSSLFPRVPVPIQKEIESKMKQRDEEYEQQMRDERGVEDGEVEEEGEAADGEEEEYAADDKEEEYPKRGGSGGDDSRSKYRRRSPQERDGRRQQSPTDRDRKRSRDRDRSRERRSRSREDRRSNEKHKHRRGSRSPQSSPHSHRHNSKGVHRSEHRSDHKRKHR